MNLINFTYSIWRHHFWLPINTWLFSFLHFSLLFHCHVQNFSIFLCSHFLFIWQPGNESENNNNPNQKLSTLILFTSTYPTRKVCPTSWKFMICSNTEIQKYSGLRCSHSYLSEQNIGPKLKTKSLLVHVRKWVKPIL